MDTNQGSAHILAPQMLRANIEEFDLAELKAHDDAELDVFNELNDYLAKPGISQSARIAAKNLRDKIEAHREVIRKAIAARQAQQRLAAALPELHRDDQPRLAMGHGFRVIRARKSADNAAPVLVEISECSPAANIPEARPGGEAKGAGARPKPGEAGR